MRAVSIDYHHRDLRERPLPEPRITREDHVLFRILETGICGTDRELASFRFGYGPTGDDFLVIGHEALGEVVEVGPAAAALGFQPGDLVAPSVRRACDPACRSCAARKRDLCLTGGYTERGIFGAHGYFTEAAVDRAEDLIRLPPSLRSCGVLLEPLSVVEKAINLALRLHAGEPRKALVLGAGTVGLLAVMALRLRGLEVELSSQESPQSARARLVQLAGASYLASPSKTDIVIEAAGAAEAAHAGLQALGPLGVMVLLGARETVRPVNLLDLIVGNQIVAGSVNAGPEAFARAATDLPLMPGEVLSRMIERTGFHDFRATLTGPPPDAPKVVHVLG